MGTGLAARAALVMQRSLVTPPALEPLTFVEAKQHLRVEDDQQDDLITSLITAARQHVENVTQRALITQTWRVDLDAFPDDDDASGWPGLIRLPYPPLQSVTSVKYYDSSGVLTTLSALLYGVETGFLSGQLRAAYDQVWPSVREQPNAVSITYVAGYGSTAASVPDALKHAMRLLIGHWYESREAVVVGTISAPLDFTVDALLAPYRVMEFA